MPTVNITEAYERTASVQVSIRELNELNGKHGPEAQSAALGKVHTRAGDALAEATLEWLYGTIMDEAGENEILDF
jgi:hypothetical protein